MPAAKYAATRTDGIYIGKDVREIIRLMLEEGYSWFKAADQVGLSRRRARRALDKPHVVAYRRERKAKLMDELSMRVPHKLNELMDRFSIKSAIIRSLYSI
jgi:hypothetical protein